ncbi:PREDICTED: synaptic vesicle glycoprotein 2C-like [Papilio xuthus]|uniref:Synaptic vesicle glycoprotein 2C-like n=1 Tax=Papilio xuthus TaxID=66420 RepID=A0AAJ6Z7F3_PAPXU|nr:PREDICTED: synaptic vesicle glycoprotein 2C-like [Papilio xuthus]
MDGTKRELSSYKLKKMETDLEEALEVAGFGKYQYFHNTLMVVILASAMIEMIGCSFLLPSAACDLDLPDNLRGIMASIPNIGVILTAPLWGRAADNLGRRPILLLSTMFAGLFGFIASFMPTLLSFALCKLAGSIFLSCPTSLCYAYAGELIPKKKRDMTLLIFNALLMLSASLTPILAWTVLSNDWLGLKPWRLLTMVYALPLFLSSLAVPWVQESPKYLVTKNKYDEALDVLKYIYAINTGCDKECFCVTTLKRSVDDSGKEIEVEVQNRGNSLLSLLRPPHLQWLALLGFLMFGLLSLLNGLYLFTPDTINKLLNPSNAAYGTICEIINLHVNTTNTKCSPNISRGTFEIMVYATLVYGALVLMLSFTPVSKKAQLVTMFLVVGAACINADLTTNRLMAGISMSALQVTALGLGPLTAYAVHLFPTNLRGTAVGAVLMFGRLGSVVGANAAGIFLARSCTATLYGFSAMLFLCAALSTLLPKDKQPRNDR